MLKRWIAALSAACVFGAANAGPVILGGDDLNDHGTWNGTANVNGWLYIQNALSNLVTQSSYPSNDGTIVVLGSLATTPAASTPTSSDGCGAVYWPAQALTPPRVVTCIDGAANITSYLAGVAGGTNRPRVIVYPGDAVGNDVDAAEEVAWAGSAATIAAYVASGGGLLGHTGDYTWLTALLPGITISTACEADPGATLTAAGIAAFPAVTNVNINAGPCHNSFGGSFGGLQVLAIDGTTPTPLPFILGGGAQTTFTPTSNAVPFMPAAFVALLVFAVAGFGVARSRKAKRE
jgi:hypothetical protein